MPVCQFQHFPGVAGGIIVERGRGVNKPKFNLLGEPKKCFITIR
jgi:hypothetical protein